MELLFRNMESWTRDHRTVAIAGSAAHTRHGGTAVRRRGGTMAAGRHSGTASLRHRGRHSVRQHGGTVAADCGTDTPQQAWGHGGTGAQRHNGTAAP